MNEEWLSAHLDGELSEAEAAELDAALAADPELVATLADLRRVRSVLRAATVEPPAGSVERIVARVEARDGRSESDARPAPVVSLRSRRRVPTFAAVAAALVIIAGVVGGFAPAESLPALGDLVAQHQAAAAVVSGEPMPADMDKMSMNEIPMEDAGVGLAMPEGYSMQHAFANDSTIQLVYMSASGDPVSVFRHEGEADFADLGAGSVSMAGDDPMWSSQRLGANVVVVDGTGYVWVVISEQSDDAALIDMMDDLPSHSPSLVERLRRTADRAIEPFRFWG
jgi:anti-sigma factor RsiW